MSIKAMKSHLIAVLGLAALLTGPVQAADIPLRKAPAVAPEDPWYGLYLGVAGGWGWGRSSHDASTGATSGRFNQDGWILGGVAGFNWHPGAIVIGVEGDISAADINGNSTPGACVNPCETKVGWLYTGRVRLGLPVGSFMPYVTAGGAAAGLKASEGFNLTAASPHVWGWVRRRHRAHGDIPLELAGGIPPRRLHECCRGGRSRRRICHAGGQSQGA